MILFPFSLFPLEPVVDAAVEAQRKKRIRIALAAVAAFVLFLVLRKK